MGEDKIKIIAFKKIDFTGKVGEYELRYNPENIQHNFGISYENLQSFGSSGTEGKYKYSYPETISFNFIFDNTIVQETALKRTVNDDIKKFKDLVFTYNGTIHRPNFLKLSWGNFLFNCQIVDCNITYKAFTPDGKPLKADAAVKFMQVRDIKTRLKEENKSSPDLSHLYIVKEGDTLPSISFQVYGSINYYLHLAKINRINNFRSLQAGQKLILPPLEK
jgi:hypothetical protein